MRSMHKLQVKQSIVPRKKLRQLDILRHEMHGLEKSFPNFVRWGKALFRLLCGYGTMWLTHPRYLFKHYGG
jgi:hypothetical protein